MNTDGLVEALVADGIIEDSSVVNGESYAPRATRTPGNYGNGNNVNGNNVNGNNVLNERFLTSAENNMPQQPRTALFTPDKTATAGSVFDAFTAPDMDFSEIQCLQRKLNGEIVVTFKSEIAKKGFYD